MCEGCKGLFFCRPHYCPERDLAMAALKRPELADDRRDPGFLPEIETLEADRLDLETVGAD